MNILQVLDEYHKEKKRIYILKINENMSIFMPCITPSCRHYPTHNL